MKLLLQFGIIFGIFWVSQCIESVLPFPFPASVISLLVLLALLLLRVIKVEKVQAETLTLLEKCGGYPNFIPSSGCDIPPPTPWENIDAFFATVKKFGENS